MKPYYADEHVTLYHGDMREVLSTLSVQADACVTDPPYGETSLEWDRWPEGWPALVAQHTSSMWCFGSMRMFLDRRDEFAGWKLSQDVVWEKHNGTGFAADRFKRVHEVITHWYRGDWRDVHHAAPREAYHGPDKSGARRTRTPHTGEIGAGEYVDDGTRMVRTVIKVPSVRRGLHPTEKPGRVLEPLISYSVPKCGSVLDPFAGSGSTLFIARSLGYRAIGIEGNEEYCERAAERLAEPDLFGGAA